MSDLIFLCYSVVSPSSLDSVITKWAPAIRALNKPIILLGNKTDMRTNEELVARLQSKNLKPVTKVCNKKKKVYPCPFYSTYETRLMDKKLQRRLEHFAFLKFLAKNQIPCQKSFLKDCLSFLVQMQDQIRKRLESRQIVM